MKLQDAYVGESNQIGSWTLIGYTGPGTKIATQTDSTETTNFLYGGGAYKGSDGKATMGGDAVAAAVGKVFPFGNIIFRAWKFNRSKIYHRRLGLAGKVLGLLRLSALHFVGSESVFFLNWKTAKNPYTWVKHFKC